MKNCFLHFTNKNLKFNLINKFVYKNTKKLPQLKNIHLNFSNTKKNSTNFKQLIMHALALESIAAQRSTWNISKKTNASLKIRKKAPVGTKVTLTNKNKHDVALKLLINVFLKNKTKFTKSFLKNAISLRNVNNFNFVEIENNFNLFQNLSPLNITYVTNADSQKENIFILKFYKVPVI